MTKKDINTTHNDIYIKIKGRTDAPFYFYKKRKKLFRSEKFTEKLSFLFLAFFFLQALLLFLLFDL